MKFFKTGQKGFTLIELLVVISILGVLAAVVILNVTKYMNSGKTQAAATEMANVQTAVSAWMYDNSGSTLSATISPTSYSTLSPYFLGAPHGTYVITNGVITSQSYP